MIKRIPFIGVAFGALVFALHFASSSSFAAEFSMDDVAPNIEVFVLTEELLAVEVSPGYRIPKWEQYPRFFAAKRSNYDFERISEEQFAAIRSQPRYERRFGRSAGSPDGTIEPDSWSQVPGDLCSEYDYNSGADTQNTFGFGDQRISVEVSCQTAVSRAVTVDNKVWMGTYRSGEFGIYSAEGLLIFDLDGTKVDSISIRGPIEELVPDPWGDDIFTLSIYGVTVVGRDFQVLAERLPEHQFDAVSKRPDVVIPSDSSGTDPVAVIAYGLGVDLYAEFFRLLAEVAYSMDDELLYQFSMLPPGTHYADPALLPEELNPILKHAEPTSRWRHFACFLSSERAKELCKEWHSAVK
jgi:hypothetical protein